MTKEDLGIDKHGHDFYAAVQNYAQQTDTTTHKLISAAKNQHEELAELQHENEEYMDALNGILNEIQRIEQLSEDIGKTEERMLEIDKMVEEGPAGTAKQLTDDGTAHEHIDEEAEEQKKALKSHLIEDLKQLRTELRDLEKKIENAEKLMSHIGNALSKEVKQENQWINTEKMLDKKSHEIDEQLGRIESLVEQHS